MHILKFGGSSVGTPERVKGVIEIVKNAVGRGPVAVVVSAFQGVTDELIAMAKTAASGDEHYKVELDGLSLRHLGAIKELISVQRQSSVLAQVKVTLNELEDALRGIFLIREISARTLDLVTSFGERLSAYIITEVFKDRNIETEYVDARLLIVTDDRFGGARVEFEHTDTKIRAYFKAHKWLQVITGFIGATEKGETTTLGRGGSDYTASIFGAALDASEVQIWTDVDGVMTADPRKVKEARVVPRMTYLEALELSHFGAKVIHPPTMRPALAKQIPLRIKNTFNPEAPGTLITGEALKNGVLVRGISSIEHVALGQVQGVGMAGVAGIAARLFGALAQEKINVILISQGSSEQSICFAIAPQDRERAKRVIDEEFLLEMKAGMIAGVLFEPDCSIIAVVGEGMRTMSGVSARFFKALGDAGVNVMAIAQGSSELNISVAVNRVDETRALQSVHNVFFPSQHQPERSLRLFIVGTGLIGGTLLNILKTQRTALQQKGIDIRVIGIANTKQMRIDPGGINLEAWRENLAQPGDPTDLKHFVQTMKDMRMPGSVLVDCTASDEVGRYYGGVLNAGISVVTPNKRANSGPYELYQQLRNITHVAMGKFLYETNVGAALPVIGTLRDLIVSGDQIIKIEAVLSGTLSYLFNSFVGERAFSDIVREAKEKGYTEPDPRDDLSGVDVARKLLILAREIGLKIELEDVEVENLVPEKAREAASVAEFFVKLQEYDAEFAKRRDKAVLRGAKLCYLGVIENGKAKVALQEVEPISPFHSLSGSDNMIVFTTERYHERPLTIRGPGAGAEVTAGGVLADILRVAG